MLLDVNLAPAVSGTTHKKRGKITSCPKGFVVESKEYFCERLRYQCSAGGRFWKTVTGGQYVSQSSEFYNKSKLYICKVEIKLAECKKTLEVWQFHFVEGK